MIEFEKLSPQVYYKESRDFQLFGRIYDVILNYLKYNTLIINDYTKNINTNSKLLELMCNTLGFKTKHNYNDLELSALCSIFIKCMKSKGSIKSIKLLLDMITCIENSSSEIKIIKDYEGKSLSILIPSDITDWTLIRDVMDYIMPAGSSYLLQSQTLVESKTETVVQLMSDVQHDNSWSPVSSSIIRAEGSDRADIVNYNIEMTLDGNTPTTGEPSTTVNPQLNSVDSRITTIDNPDTDQDRVNEALTKATSKPSPQPTPQSGE